MMMNKFLRFIRKNLILVIVLVVILAILIVFLCVSGNDKTKSDLKVKTNDINISNIDDGYNNDIKVSVTNSSNKVIKYDLVWRNVTNGFKTQNDLLYSISSNDEGATRVGTSQVPVVDSPIMTDISLDANSKHSYTVKIWYKKSKKSKDDKNSDFKGKVIAIVHKDDKK